MIMTNYRQKLLHEAMQELGEELPGLVAHVTDINSDWKSKARGERIYLAYAGAIYPIRKYDSTHRWGTNELSIWGQQALIAKSDAKRREVVTYIKEYIKSTLQHAEKDRLNRRGLDNIYPGLAR